MGWRFNFFMERVCFMIRKIFSKKILLLVINYYLLTISVFAQEVPEVIEVESGSGVREIGETTFPEPKRPKKIDKDKIEKSEADSEEGSLEKNKDVLKFGMDSEITELIDDIVKKEDVRFVEEIYDLFQVTKSTSIRDKIIEYFTKLEDPCIEDYAVEIIDDPFDQKKSTVDLCFFYIQKVKTKEAVNPVLRLIDSEEEAYFNNALTTLGDIGGSEEAVFLTEFLERNDLTIPQKQSLVKVLGKIKAVETFDALVEMAEDEDENTFVRMYSAEAIGAMQKPEAVAVLTRLFEENDPNLRQFALKGLSHFDTEEVKNIILQATRDSHVKVRSEAISIIKEKEMKEGVPYLIFRAKNDPETKIKYESFPVIAGLGTKEGSKYLLEVLEDKKISDTTKSKVVQAILDNWEKCGKIGTEEILNLAEETLKDDRRKSLRYAIGKEMAKHGLDAFEDITIKYLESKDVATVGTGLDIYAKGRYSSVRPKVVELAKEHQKYLDYEENKAKLDPKTKPVKKNANAEKASKILKSGSDKGKDFGLSPKPKGEIHNPD